MPPKQMASKQFKTEISEYSGVFNFVFFLIVCDKS